MIHNILFLSGSYESQRIAKIGAPKIALYNEIKKHFIYSCLLAKNVIQPVGHYFQSEMIRRVTQEFFLLFMYSDFGDGTPIAYFAINMDKESFREDADEKEKTFLNEIEFSCYHDKQLRQSLTKSLSDFAPYRRKGKQLDTLSEITKQECTVSGSLYRHVEERLNDPEKTKIALEPLIKAVEKREYAILPEYIELLDENKELNKYMLLTRLVLMEAYAGSCAQLYHTCYVNNPIKIFYPNYSEQDFKYQLSYLDTNIFDLFLNIMPETKKAILNANAKEIMKIRNSIRFKRFKDYYETFIDTLEDKFNRIEIEKCFINEYEFQFKKYKKGVKVTIEDNPKILYHAISNCINSKKLLSSEKYLDYDEYPIMSLVSEIAEKIIGSYEEYLFQYYKAKRINQADLSDLHNHIFASNNDKEHKHMSKMELVRVGIVTALPKEFAAMKRMLNNVEEIFVEKNRYYIGELTGANNKKHMIALGRCMMGNNYSSIYTSNMQNSFKNMNLIIMTGIAGGIPSIEDIGKHVRLGDIVVSEEIIQYDFIKETDAEIQYRSNASKPSATLREAIEDMRGKEYDGIFKWRDAIDEYAIGEFKKPDVKLDLLHDEKGNIIKHPEDDARSKYPKIFYGKIGSANTLLKNYNKREKLKKECRVLAVEMEGSGIADATWCSERNYIVIRGICDYCDHYKNDIWQNYAALVAAAYTKALIENLPVIY